MIRSIIDIYLTRWPWLLGLLGNHIRLALIAICIAGALGLLIGIFISERRQFAPFAIGMCNAFYTIPAISLLGLLIPFTGIGNRTAIDRKSVV